MFDEEGALDRFEAFASLNGPRFYGLPVNEETVTLERAEVEVPDEIEGLVPFHAGETLALAACSRLAAAAAAAGADHGVKCSCSRS